MVAVRHLILPADPARNQASYGPQTPCNSLSTQIQFPLLAQFLIGIADVPYTSHPMAMLKASIKINRKEDMRESVLRELFCSELIAEAYVAMGLLQDDSVAYYNFTPQDFCSLSPWHLGLQRGAGLTLEHRMPSPADDHQPAAAMCLKQRDSIEPSFNGPLEVDDLRNSAVRNSLRDSLRNSAVAA